MYRHCNRLPIRGHV